MLGTRLTRTLAVGSIAAGRVDGVEEVAADHDVADPVPFAPQIVGIARLNLDRTHLLMSEDVVLDRHVAGEDEKRTCAVVVESAVADDDVVRVVRPVEEYEAVFLLLGNVLCEGDVEAVPQVGDAFRLHERAEEARGRIVAVAELHPVALPCR